MKRRLELVGLQAVSILAALNVWTGSPLLALWVGSRLAGAGGMTMGAVLAVAVVMLGCSLALVKLLAMSNAAYGRLTGRPSTVRRHVPWLRSMRAERVDWERSRSGLTPAETAMVAMVVVAVVAFEVWFFFFSTSPIDARTGRD